MNVLVVGGGGREHALCWKLAQSPGCDRVYCAPGNAGIEAVAEIAPMDVNDFSALIEFARQRQIGLTVVGPEDPLCGGIVDRFAAADLRVFGPTAAAARLEGDKAYAKKLMREAGIPTAEARIFGPTAHELTAARHGGKDRDESAMARLQSGFDMARDYVATRDEGLVVKAAGLARGKGVFVHADPSDAIRTIEALMVERRLGDAGATVVVEALLSGHEVSVLALVDGRNIYLLEAATDHKRLGEADTGPNTGGMGAYSPTTTLTDADINVIKRDVFVPIIDALRRDGVEYRGVLYAGLMLTAGGPKVLEFNCRFGDPEAQPILMRWESDLLEALNATVDGRLDRLDIRWDRRAAVCVVLAAKGYPDDYPKGMVIEGLDEAVAMQRVQVFHSGTARRDGNIVTAGGRVLGVTALADTLASARQRAYAAAHCIQFDGLYLRGDIAREESNR